MFEFTFGVPRYFPAGQRAGAQEGNICRRVYHVAVPLFCQRREFDPQRERGLFTSRPPDLVPAPGSRVQRKTLHLPLVHANRRGSGQTEEQGRQKARQHRQGEGEQLGETLKTGRVL